MDLCWKFDEPLQPAGDTYFSQCKRLLDAGRVAYLQSLPGFDAKLVHYIGEEVSPENCMLLVFPKGEVA